MKRYIALIVAALWVVALIIHFTCGIQMGSLDERAEAAIEQSLCEDYLENPTTFHVVQDNDYFGYKQRGNVYEVYGYANVSSIGFMNGYCSDYAGGTGFAAPFVATIDWRGDDPVCKSIVFPKDGSEYRSSIKDLFPITFQHKALHPRDDVSVRENLSEQAKEYCQEQKLSCVVSLTPNVSIKMLPDDVSLAWQQANIIWDDNTHYPDFLGTVLTHEKDGKNRVWLQSYDEDTQKIYFANYKDGATTATAKVYQYKNGTIRACGTETISVSAFFQKQ